MNIRRVTFNDKVWVYTGSKAGITAAECGHILTGEHGIDFSLGGKHYMVPFSNVNLVEYS